MGLRINQNISALNAARNLRSTNASMGKSLERLSSGYRINRAADDPAGLIISENLRSQIAGLGQAVKNSDNAVNVIKTSEAALGEVLKQLRAIRTLALDALTTGSSDKVSRAADQVQIDSSIETIDRIGNTTQYGTIKLLNGDSGVKGSTNSDDLKFILGSSDTVASGTTGYGVEITQLATQGSQAVLMRNEFITSNGGADFEMAANDSALFQIDFGVGAGLTDSDVQELGTSLKAVGLQDDSSQTGVKVFYNETDATAYILLEREAAAADNTIDATMLANLNNSSIGKIVQFNAGTSRRFQLTGRFAGLDFQADQISHKGGTSTFSEAGTTGLSEAAGAQAGITDVVSVINAATTSSSIVEIDFGAGASDAAGKAAIGAAMSAAGLTANNTIPVGIAQNTITGTIVFDATTAKVTVTLTAAGNTGNNGVNAASSFVNVVNASSHALGKFVKFLSAGARLSAIFAHTVANQVTIKDPEVLLGRPNLTVENGFSTGVSNVIGAQAAQDATEAATLGAGTGVSISDIKVLDETFLTINDSSVVSIEAGASLIEVSSRISAVLAADDLELTVTFTPDTAAGTGPNNKFTLTNTKFGSAINTMKSNRARTLSHHLGIGTSPLNIQGKDIGGTINSVQAEGEGQFLTLNSKGDNADQVKVKYTGTALPVAGTLKAFTTQDSLVFQIGANAGQTVRQAIADIRARKLGTLATDLLTSAESVANINVLTADGAKDALTLVDSAITEITTLRGKLGAFQLNILEANINSLGVAQESLAAAESVIRDADFAAETAGFTRTQILLQAGTAILTQANAIPQAVLQLLA